MAKKSEFLIYINSKLNAAGFGPAIAGLEKIRLGAVAAGRALLRIGGVMAGALSAIGIGGVKAASDMETLKTQLEAVLGSAEEAAAAFKESFDFSVATPFSPEEIVQTRIALESVGVTGGAAVEKVATASAAMGRNIIDVASAVRSMETEPLRNLGIMLKRDGDKFVFDYKDKMKQARTVTADGFAEAQQALLDIMSTRFEGGLEKMSQTFSGLWSTLIGNMKAGLADFGEQYLPSVKAGIQSVNAALDGLRESGKLKEWGQAVNTALAEAAEKTTGIISYIRTEGAQGVKEIADASKDVVVGLFRMGAEKAGELLITIAPIVGKLIADQFRELLSPNMDKVAFFERLGNATNVNTKQPFTREEKEQLWLQEQGKTAAARMERGGLGQFRAGLDKFSSRADIGNAERAMEQERRQAEIEERSRRAAEFNSRQGSLVETAGVGYGRLQERIGAGKQSVVQESLYGTKESLESAQSSLQADQALATQIYSLASRIKNGIDGGPTAMAMELLQKIIDEQNRQADKIKTLDSQIRTGRS